MPEKTITIDREKRSGLYELIRNHLGSIEDFWVAMERTKDFAVAERLGLEFAEDFGLLQDLGWSEHDHRDAYVLTMPAHELEGALRRLLGEAVELLVETGSEAEASRRDADRARSFQIGFETCKTILTDLDSLSRNA